MKANMLVFIAIACAVSCVRAGTVNITVNRQAPNITRNGCGTSKLCLTPCDPAANASSCFFASSRLDSTSSLIFELSGATTGYVALGLATNLTQGAVIVFVCGNSNATNSTGFTFLTASNTANGLNLNTTVNTINSVQGVVANNQTLKQSYIQCVFNTTANLTTITSKLTTTSFYVSILSGVMNGNTPGSSNTQFNSTVLLDLTNSKANLANSTNSTSTSAPTVVTTGGSDSLSSPVAHALSILLGAIGLLLLF